MTAMTIQLPRQETRERHWRGATGAAQATPVIIRLKDCPTAKKAAVFQLTGASPNPVPAGDLAANAGEIRTELPAQSISTLVIQAP